MEHLDGTSRVILRLAIILGITLLYPAVIYLGAAALAERPEHPDYFSMLPQDQSAEGRAKYLESLRAMQAVEKEAQRKSARLLFWIAVPLALAALAAGLSRRLGDIGTGLVLGGLATLALTQCRTLAYDGADALRFAAGLIALVLLILVARRRLAA